MRMTNVVGLLLFLYSWLALATPLPQDNPVPGGIAVVPIEVKASGRPDVFFQNRPVMRLKKESSWYAVVGIPLSVKPGDHELEIADAAGNILAVRFAVNNKSYASQHITLKNKKMVDPGKKELERIWREKKIINKALNSWNENIAWETYFLKPANGTLRDNFGLRRFFNKKPRNPHSGIDISAPKDSPVIAPAAGTVIKTGHYYFNWKTIFLDH